MQPVEPAKDDAKSEKDKPTDADKTISRPKDSEYSSVQAESEESKDPKESEVVQPKEDDASSVAAESEESNEEAKNEKEDDTKTAVTKSARVDGDAKKIASVKSDDGEENKHTGQK